MPQAQLVELLLLMELIFIIHLIHQEILYQLLHLQQVFYKLQAAAAEMAAVVAAAAAQVVTLHLIVNLLQHKLIPLQSAQVAHLQALIRLLVQIQALQAQVIHLLFQ
jgi:hypothetical protein